MIVDLDTDLKVSTTFQGYPPELREHLGFLLLMTRRRLAEDIDATLPTDGPSLRHFGVLSVIYRRNDLKQVDIGDALGIDRTTTMKLIRELESRGMLQRTRRIDDRRAYTVALTDRGNRWRASVMLIVLKQQERFLESLSAGERTVLLEMLAKLVERAHQRNAKHAQSVANR